MIWPEHCLIGSWGWTFVDPILKAVHQWEENAVANIISKGSCLWVEHYSALRAEVPFDGDETTLLNARVIKMFKEADILLWAGWASSHCLRFTFDDAYNELGAELAKKMVLLEDCMSPVGKTPDVDFPQLTEEWLHDLSENKGITITNSIDFWRKF